MADMIKFYKGLEASLPTVGTSGALYITTDEGAIYLGTGTGMKRIGDFVQVENAEALPTKAHENCLYYCVAENILAKWDGTEWKQVNKQPTTEELKTLLGLGSLAYLSEVAEANLSAELAEKINASTAVNHSHDNKDVLDGITADQVSAWDAAESNAKGYADDKVAELANGQVNTNKTDIANLTQTVADNKTELEGKITATAEAAATDATNKANAAQAAAIADADGKIGTLTQTVADNKSELEGKITDAANAAAADATTKANAAQAAAIAEATAQVTGVSDTVAQLTETVANNKTELEKTIGDAKDDAIKHTDDKVAELTENIGNDTKKLEEDLAKETARAKEAEGELQTQINTIMNNPDTEGVINSINEFTQYIEDHGEIAEGFRTDIDKNKEDIAANAKAIADQATSDAETYETKEDASAKLDEAKEYADGVLDRLPIATTETAGIVKAGKWVNVDEDGTISVYTEKVESETIRALSYEPVHGSDDFMFTMEKAIPESWGSSVTIEGGYTDEPISISGSVQEDRTKVYIWHPGFYAPAELIYVRGESVEYLVDLSDYDTKSEVDAKVAVKANSADVYTKTETYTQDEVDAAIATAVEEACSWGSF